MKLRRKRVGPKPGFAVRLLRRRDLAGWVQAVGAIAALIFAFWYPERRIQLQAEEQKLQQVTRLATLSLSVNQTMLSLYGSYRDDRVTDVHFVDAATIDHWLSRLRAVDETALTERQLRAYFAIDRCIRFAAHRLARGNAVIAPSAKEIERVVEDFYKQAHEPLMAEFSKRLQPPP